MEILLGSFLNTSCLFLLFTLKIYWLGIWLFKRDLNERIWAAVTMDMLTMDFRMCKNFISVNLLEQCIDIQHSSLGAGCLHHLRHLDVFHLTAHLDVDFLHHVPHWGLFHLMVQREIFSMSSFYLHLTIFFL